MVRGGKRRKPRVGAVTRDKYVRPAPVRLNISSLDFIGSARTQKGDALTIAKRKDEGLEYGAKYVHYSHRGQLGWWRLFRSKGEHYINVPRPNGKRQKIVFKNVRFDL